MVYQIVGYRLTSLELTDDTLLTSTLTRAQGGHHTGAMCIPAAAQNMRGAHHDGGGVSDAVDAGPLPELRQTRHQRLHLPLHRLKEDVEAHQQHLACGVTAGPGDTAGSGYWPIIRWHIV